jgi:hypothetical protein
MGFTRKMMSLGTVGLVDFRSDKERTASYTQAAKKEAKKQTRLMKQMAAAQTRAAQAEQQAAQAAQWQAAPAAQLPAPQSPPAGWYPDQVDQSLVRWFDGTQWTEFTQPRT